MIILAIDSSTPVAGVALMDQTKIWAESFLNIGNTHSELLMPMIEEIFQKAKLKPQDIDAIVVSKGPGSFTGLRIGMVTGKSLAQVLDKKLIAIPTLDFLAFNLWRQSGLICPILDARRNEVYTALYEFKGVNIYRRSDHMALNPLELVEIIKATNQEVTFLGDGVAVYQKLLNCKLGSQAFWAPATHLLPRATTLGFLGLQALAEDKEDDIFNLVPLYLRRSEAEVRWEAGLCQR